MNKLLRKKKRVGEFKELGFELRADLRPGRRRAGCVRGSAHRRVEARMLGFGRGAGRDDKLDGVVRQLGRGSAIDDDRTALAVFVAGDDAVVRHEIGALRDA